MKTSDRLEDDARLIYASALEAVNPETCLKEAVRVEGQIIRVREKPVDLRRFKNIYAAALGKSACFMARALHEILGRRLTAGAAVGPSGTVFDVDGFEVIGGSHPLPGPGSVRGARAVLNLARRAGKDDLLFVLLSGGGSSLVCRPRTGISLEEVKSVTEMLLKAGADIRELNAVRKHLSRIKGGFLAGAAAPAEVIGLVVSDVPGNDLGAVASGPAYRDVSTFRDADNILAKYGLREKAPKNVVLLLQKGIRGEIPETLKPKDPRFRRVEHFIIADNGKALAAAQKKAELLGYETAVLSSSDGGEARTKARVYTAVLHALKPKAAGLKRPLCLLAGGELTVTVRGGGKGGRNQEFVLAALIEAGKQKPASKEWLISSLGTDGIDGPTDAAGAWGGPSVLERASKLSLDPEEFLRDNDAYTFFDKTGGLIRTGPTGTNVMDIRLFFV